MQAVSDRHTARLLDVWWLWRAWACSARAELCRAAAALALHPVARNKQLHIKGLEELEKRTKLRWLVNAKVKEAKTQLEAYLREFPLADGRGPNGWWRWESAKMPWWTWCGAREVARRQALAERRRLVRGFRRLVPGPPRRGGLARVNYWARRTAVGTAVSPNTLTDTAMTLYFSFTMLADLCDLQSPRPAVGTAVLLARVFFNAYLAGQINEMENMTAEQIQNLVAPHIPASECSWPRCSGKMGAKASAGVINFFLLNRLGKYSSRMLRPVTRE